MHCHFQLRNHHLGDGQGLSLRLWRGGRLVPALPFFVASEGHMHGLKLVPTTATLPAEADYWLGFFFILDVVSTITLVLDLTWAQASARFPVVFSHLGGREIYESHIRLWRLYGRSVLVHHLFLFNSWCCTIKNEGLLMAGINHHRETIINHSVLSILVHL